MKNISIHAPVKGATDARQHRSGFTHDFNPRTREGCDGGCGLQVFNAKGISIHAPVKGATISLNRTKREILVFQSTHP